MIATGEDESKTLSQLSSNFSDQRSKSSELFDDNHVFVLR